MATKAGNRQLASDAVTLGGFLAEQFNDIGETLGLDESGSLRISDTDLIDFARLVEPKGRTVLLVLLSALVREGR